MNRRGFFKALAGAAAGGALIGSQRPARAAWSCTPDNGWGQSTCTVGIRSHLAHSAAAAVGGQHMSQWCWAACISMVFRHHGYAVGQRRIVREAWGNIVDLPNDAYGILRSLNRRWVDDRGRGFVAYADAGSANPSTATEDLKADMPLIIGTHGHAMVLTAVTYQQGWWGQQHIVEAIVRDPWPGRGRRPLSAAEWYNTAFLARIRVQKA